MSAEIIDRLEQRVLKLEIVAYNAMHSENLLIEWAAMPERNSHATAKHRRENVDCSAGNRNAQRTYRTKAMNIENDGFSILDSYVLQVERVRISRRCSYTEFNLVPPPRLVLKNRKRFK